MGGYTQLKMVWHDAGDLPEVVAPSGCVIRAYNPGDEESWARIMNTGVGTDWTVEKARDQLFCKPQFDPAGMFFAQIGDEVVGSACAWYGSQDTDAEATVHMVCVLPEARGRNLGYLLTLRVLHYFHERGVQEVFLQTDDFRIPAIKAYLRLGFKPVFVDETHENRWQRLMSDL